MSNNKKTTIGRSVLFLTIVLIVTLIILLIPSKNPKIEGEGKVSLGDSHSSLLTEDGKMFTWGHNSKGQLGNGSNEGEMKKTPINITNQFINEENEKIDLINSQISHNTFSSSLLTNDGRLFTWGLNSDGQLGDGTRIDKNTPTDITDQFENDEEELIDLTNAQISMGGSHSSLLTEDGRLFMWGRNEYGQLGNGKSSGFENTPTEITNQFVNDEDELINLTNGKISMGGEHSSLLTEDGKLFMWGNNEYGQLGDGAENNKNKPTEITDQFFNDEDELINLTNAQIEMGGFHSSLLTQDGRLFMWGRNEYGQLGNGGNGGNKNIPLEVTNQFINEEDEQVDLTDSQISMGEFHSSLLTQDGKLFMWGNNLYGQIGDNKGGFGKIQDTPTEITDQFVNDEDELINLTNAQIEMGEDHSALLTEDNRVFTWGYNYFGQLGNGQSGNIKKAPIEITKYFNEQIL